MIYLTVAALCLLPAIASANEFVEGNPPIISETQKAVVDHVLNPINDIKATIGDIGSTIGTVNGTVGNVKTAINTLINLPNTVKNSLLSTLKGASERINRTNDLNLDLQVISSLHPVKVAIARNTGEAGIPDPFKTQGQILQNLPARTLSDINPIVLVSGQVAMRSTDIATNSVLSLEGQKERSDALQQVIAAGDLMGILTQGSNQTGKAVLKTATNISGVAQFSAQSAQTSMSDSSKIKAQSVTIKGARSTQDAIKGLGEQNAMIGSILATQSAQSAQSAQQLTGVSEQLGGLSVQSAQSANQLDQIGVILGDQDKTLRGIETQGAISNLNLSQISENDQAEAQEAAIESKREYAQLDHVTGYRLAR